MSGVGATGGGHPNQGPLHVHALHLEILGANGLVEPRKDVDRHPLGWRPVPNRRVGAPEVVRRDQLDLGVVPQRPQRSLEPCHVLVARPHEEVHVLGRPDDSVQVERHSAHQDVVHSVPEKLFHQTEEQIEVPRRAPELEPASF